MTYVDVLIVQMKRSGPADRSRMSIVYLLIAATTPCARDEPGKVAFVMTLGVATLAVGVVMDGYHERSGHNREP